MRSTLFIRTGLGTLLLTSMVFHGVSAQQLLTRDSEKIDFAQQLLDKSQYLLAASEFEEFIQQYPKSTFLAQAYLGDGDSYFFLKDYNKAIDRYQQYAKDFPDGNKKWFAILRWGQCLYLAGKQDEALAKLNTIDAAAIEVPFRQTLYFYLGQVYMSRKDLDLAGANFEKAAHAQGSGGYSSQAYLQWGNVLSQQANYLQAGDKYTKAFDLADSNELKAEILMKQAYLHFAQQDYSEAAQLFNRVTIDYPSLPVVHDAKVNYLTSLLKSRQLDKLLTCYDQQFKDNFKDPAFFQVHFSAVEALLQLKKVDEALAILDKFMTLPAMDAATRDKAIIRKTEILMQANKFPEVVAFTDGQKSLDHDTALAVMLLKAKALQALKKDDTAWDIYLGITKEYPDSPDTYCDMAQLRYTQNNLQGAASLFMDCFNKDKKGPGAEDALYNAFLMYQKSGVKDRAIETAASYRQQYPQGRWSYDLIMAWAELYTKDQKYDQAAEVLKPWIEKTADPHWPQVLFQAGYNLQLSGKSADALLAYEKLSGQNIPVELKYFVLKNSAVIYLKQNDQDKAAQALGWIIQNFPPSNLPLKDYLWLAQYWESKNEPQKMLDILVQAQKIQVGALETIGINFFMAEAYRMQNNCAQAEGQYDQVTSDKGKNMYQGRAYLGRGMCFSSKGDKDKARKEYEQAIALNLEDNFVTLRARFELAGLDEAQQDLKQAAKLYMMVGILYKDAEYGPRALLQAGVLLQKLNETQAAVKAYQQILDDYPHSEQALKAKELIGKAS